MERIEETCPIRGTHSRLHQTHRLWHQVQQEYDNPEGFCTNLNAAIQALRSVTFVLQKEQRAIPEFESWYAGWQAHLRQDALMVWLVQARNHIEKEGDLDTYSSARVVLLADWHDSQPLVELQIPPLTQTKEILSKLPELHLPTYALQEGLLE